MRRTVEEGLRRQHQAGLRHAQQDEPDWEPYQIESNGRESAGLQRGLHSRSTGPRKEKKKKRPATDDIGSASVGPASVVKERRVQGQEKRIEILLQRNRQENRLAELALPALIVPKEVSVITLCRLIQEFAFLPGVVVEDIVLTLQRPGSRECIELGKRETMQSILLNQWRGVPDRLTMQYQSRDLAVAMGIGPPVKVENKESD